MKAIWYEAAIYVSRDETYLWNRATLMIFCWSILSIAIPYTFVSGTRFFRIIVTIIGTAACWSWSTFTCIAVLWEKKKSKKMLFSENWCNWKQNPPKTVLTLALAVLLCIDVHFLWRKIEKKNNDEIMENKIKI